MTIDETCKSVAYILDVKKNISRYEPKFNEIIPFDDVGTPNLLFSKMKDRCVNMAFIAEDTSIQAVQFSSMLPDQTTEIGQFTSIDLSLYDKKQNSFITHHDLQGKNWFPSENVKTGYLRSQEAGNFSAEQVVFRYF